jgi:predicted ribosome quality control (RQC) complex YloA/Tae2 family protein
MVKLRLSSIDAKAAIDEVRASAVGMRLLNVYDLSPRVYLLKFGQGEKKVYVLFESGVRLHITNFSREKPKVPSQFTLKLRKHVRSWRLEGVEQIGTDRIVDLRFGSGDQAHHFVLELYGQGNFFLTDAKYTILMLLRSAKSEDVRLAVRETFPVEHAKQYAPKQREEILQALNDAKDNDTLKACLPLNFYGSLLADHMLASCGLNPTERKKSWADHISSIADSVFNVCQSVDSLMLSDLVGGGVLIKLGTAAEVKAARAAEAAASTSTASPAGKSTDEELDDAEALNRQLQQQPPAAAAISTAALPSTTVDNPDEFWPQGVERFLDRSRIVALERVRTFSEAADRCFRTTEQEKISAHNVKKEQVVLSKKEKFLRDHQRRIDNLTTEQDRNRRLAELIQLNVDDVDAAVNLVNDVLATGMSWDRLGSLIRLRQSEGTHPVANIIHELKLYKNSISLLLSQDVGDDDEVEDADLEPVIVDVDIGLTAYGNAAKYHSQKKTVSKKLEKTIEATDKAAEAAGKTGERQAKKVVEKRDITQMRQPMWFEKFNWFLTSHGHIVVSGHDPMQADLLFRRYLSPGDIFVHGDAVGCLPAIVKNPSFGKIPLPSVEEAGISCIARSEAWRRAPVSGWWCLATQVSKRTPQGDHLGLGQFHVRGTKNYMPAMQLQLAVAVIFKSNRVRAPRESAGVPHVNVSEVWQQDQQAILQQQQQQQQHQQQSAGGAATSRASNTSASGRVVPRSGESEAEAETENRQSSDDITETATGNVTNPLSPQSRDVDRFPDAPIGGDGAPLAAQLQLQQQQLSAIDRRSKVKHLKRGQGSSHSSQGAPAESETSVSDQHTISMTSTRTPSMATSRNPSRAQSAGAGATGASPGQGTPGIQDVLSQTNLSSRALTKLKKIKKKYAGQDEEDRQRAMALHGNTISKVHQVLIQAEEVKKHGSADDSDNSSDDGGDEGRPGASRVKFADEQVASNDDAEAEENAPGSGSDGDDECRSAAGMERAHQALNQRSNSYEDDTVKIAERMADEAARVVPFLDGSPEPSPEVTIDDCVVICAPYAAVRHYAFKARIAPGTDKKGQAAQGILAAFSKHVPELYANAESAIKLVSSESVIAQLPGPLKVHLGDIAASSTAVSAPGASIGGTGSAPGGEDPNLTAKQKQKLKKEEQERLLMEKLRAERRARLEKKSAIAA